MILQEYVGAELISYIIIVMVYYSQAVKLVRCIRPCFFLPRYMQAIYTMSLISFIIMPMSVCYLNRAAGIR